MRIYCILLILFYAGLVAAEESINPILSKNNAYFSAELKDDGSISSQWKVLFDDVATALAIDSNGDGDITKNEFEKSASRIEAYVNSTISLVRAKKTCGATVGKNWIFSESDSNNYLLIPIDFYCLPTGDFGFTYKAIFEKNDNHKLFFNVTRGADTLINATLAEHSKYIFFHSKDFDLYEVFKRFVFQGFIHILTGYDHLLFLITLLLACVLVRKNNAWVPHNSAKKILKNAFWIVTAFTVAHSITLTAAALNWITPPSKIVEIIIALTVALSAINNIFPVVLRLGWVVFCFGLLHGMGFAGALAELGLDQHQRIASLIAFNLGVELGQFILLVVILPLFIGIRHYFWYSRYLMTISSGLIGLMAIVWFFNRI